MNRHRPPSRRVLALLASALLGLAGAVAIGSPASATPQTEVAGGCEWDDQASEWVVSWTVSSSAAGQLTEVVVTPEDQPVDGIASGDSFDANAPLTGEQRLPEDAGSASLTVHAQWDDGQTGEYGGEVQVPADCTAPETTAPEFTDQLGDWTVSCDALTITVANPTDEALTLTFAPSVGDPVDVEVAGGESATVQFPPSEGLTVDVLVNGEPVEIEEPIEITAGALAGLECDEDEDGEGGGLPATGTSVAIFAGGAVLLLGLGTGLYLLARRRRVTFTA